MNFKRGNFQQHYCKSAKNLVLMLLFIVAYSMYKLKYIQNQHRFKMLVLRECYFAYMYNSHTQALIYVFFF